MENKTYKFAVKGDARKKLVSILQQQLQEKMEYLGMPSAAYRLGSYHIDRHGTVTGPELSLAIMVALLEQGYEPEADPSFHLITPRGPLLCQRRYDTAAEAEADGYGIYFTHEGRDVYTKDSGKEYCPFFAVVGAPFEEAAADEPEEEPAEEETDRVCIEYPREGMSDTAIENLCRMVEAKAELIKLAIGAQALPIEVLEDRIAFDWLQTTDPEMVDALATFIVALCKTAREKKRMTAAPQPTGINDRYRFRCFTLHIGMIGPAYATARTKLMAPLSGSSGWLVPPEKAPQETPSEAPAAEEDAQDTAPTVEESEVTADE